MILAANVGMEGMGHKTFGFAGGRVDLWEPEEDIYWGPEKTWLAAERGAVGDGLQNPLGAVQMGLIYVNPEGHNGNPDPLESAHDIRTTFARMAMGDEETVALCAGGHTFGKAHGAAPDSNLGPAPEGAPIEEQGLGWKNKFRTGKGADTISSGLEGAWTTNPAKWDNGYFHNLFAYEWEMTKSPAGATQWIPKNGQGAGTVPDAHDPSKRHTPIMFTTDLALIKDPAYLVISKRFHADPKLFEDTYARAWYKLVHRDMGPIGRCLGPDVGPEQIWQDPVGTATTLLGEADVTALKAKIAATGLTVAEMVSAAWASASSYRCTDHRGGANGARVRLSPQKDWGANDPVALTKVLKALEGVQKGHKSVSMADLLVLAGCVGVEAGLKAAGSNMKVPFKSGRSDATDAQTDAASFGVLEPFADGFRNYWGPAAKLSGATEEALLVDKAHMLTLSKTEMTALVGGLRVLGANTSGNTALMSRCCDSCHA
jgi:catalase-peroxidase